MKEHVTAAMLLARGLTLPPLPEAPISVPSGTACAITGAPISAGYPVHALTTAATTEFLECFRGGVHGYVEEAAARCFKSSNPRTGNPCARSHFAFCDAYHAPLIAREAPKGQEGTRREAPIWSDLVRAVWPERQGQTCLVLVTTDTKKRLWIRARVGALGPKTPVYYYDSKTVGGVNLVLDWAELLRCLDLVEEVYGAGFAKNQIRSSLFGSSLTATLGLARVQAWEKALRAWRERPEFLFAVLIAQKPIVPLVIAQSDSAHEGVKDVTRSRSSDSRDAQLALF